MKVWPGLRNVRREKLGSKKITIYRSRNTEYQYLFYGNEYYRMYIVASFPLTANSRKILLNFGTCLQLKMATNVRGLKFCGRGFLKVLGGEWDITGDGITPSCLRLLS